VSGVYIGEGGFCKGGEGGRVCWRNVCMGGWLGWIVVLLSSEKINKTKWQRVVGALVERLWGWGLCGCGCGSVGFCDWTIYEMKRLARVRIRGIYIKQSKAKGISNDRCAKCIKRKSAQTKNKTPSSCCRLHQRPLPSPPSRLLASSLDLFPSLDRACSRLGLVPGRLAAGCKGVRVSLSMRPTLGSGIWMSS